MIDCVNDEISKQCEHLGMSPDLLSRCVFINENIFFQDQISKQGLKLIKRCIKNFNKIPVLCLSANPVDIDRYTTTLNQYVDPRDYFIFNFDSRPEKNTAPNIAHWPFTLIMQQLGVQDYSTTFFKKYRISLLSRHRRIHRLKLITTIKPFVTISDVVVGNARLGEPMTNEVSQESTTVDMFNQLPWANSPEYIDLDPNSEQITYTDIEHPAYRALVNITNETSYEDNIVFLTEKTWKAYSSKCLVINYGSKDVPTELERLGIQIWKEYDLNLSYPEKINKIVELFQRNDIEDIYKSNTALIEHNYQLVTSKEFACSLAQPAIDKLLNFKPA